MITKEHTLTEANDLFEQINECMLTTVDNPFDPFEQFNEWFMFDIEKGYYSCSRLARIANITDDMSSAEVEVENERAIDEIIKYDFLDVYKKVYNTKTSEKQESTDKSSITQPSIED